MNFDVPQQNLSAKEKLKKMEEKNLGKFFSSKEQVNAIIDEMNALNAEVSGVEDLESEGKMSEIVALQDEILGIEKKYETPTTSETEINEAVVLINESSAKLKELLKQEIEYLKKKLEAMEKENLEKTFTSERESGEILDRMNSIGSKIKDLESKFVAE